MVEELLHDDYTLDDLERGFFSPLSVVGSWVDIQKHRL